MKKEKMDRIEKVDKLSFEQKFPSLELKVCKECKMNGDDGAVHTDLIIEHCLDKKVVLKAIDKFIKTDLQGRSLPECEILWKIKKELKL